MIFRSYLPFFPLGLVTLVITISFLTLMPVKPSESCHRRVEYHHYYKKPQKGWGWGWQKGHNHGHKGQGHGKGHGHGQGYGHEMKGYGHEMKGYGGQGGHKGKKGHGHGGYGHEEMKGYGHEMMKGYGHEMKGYGHGGDGGGHKEGYGQEEMKGYGHKGGYGHEEGGYGHDEKGHGKGHGHGGGYESAPMQKGMQYKIYEMTSYGNKVPFANTNGHQHQARYTTPLQREYGYSGPYPNTEYSSPIQATINPSYNEVGHHTSSSNLGVADVANRIRNSKNPSQFHNANNNGGGVQNTYLATPILLDPLPLSSDKDSLKSSNNNNNNNNRGRSRTESISDDGNFDMNLEFNEDAPFRRSETLGKSGKKKKKLSSTFKAKDGGFDSFIDSGQDGDNDNAEEDIR